MNSQTIQVENTTINLYDGIESLKLVVPNSNNIPLLSNILDFLPETITYLEISNTQEYNNLSLPVFSINNLPKSIKYLQIDGNINYLLENCSLDILILTGIYKNNPVNGNFYAKEIILNFIDEDIIDTFQTINDLKPYHHFNKLHLLVLNDNMKMMEKYLKLNLSEIFNIESEQLNNLTKFTITKI